MKRAVAILLTDGQRVLTVTRRNSLNWCLPGGKVEDESDENAIKRELYEETGINITTCFPLHSSVCKSDEIGVYYWCTTYFSFIDFNQIELIEMEIGIKPQLIGFNEFSSELNNFPEYNTMVLEAYKNFCSNLTPSFETIIR